MQKIIYTKNLINKKTALAVFLFLSQTSYAFLPPGKIKGFQIQECNQFVCFSTKGEVGYTSKLADIFSASDATVEMSSKAGVNIENFACDDLKIEIEDQIISCRNNQKESFVEINIGQNTIKRMSLK